MNGDQSSYYIGYERVMTWKRRRKEGKVRNGIWYQNFRFYYRSWEWLDAKAVNSSNSLYKFHQKVSSNNLSKHTQDPLHSSNYNSEIS